eukprot:CAMPEP_0119111636 /NCGR_PEP_ID=MMETSP1180-20130426/36531_1 /TAXON_ID=3052 ORGANISM="Chlamydomonas cf sp, Strain CCMP681" /NCGR_SAMPLE_ID=MMETSP1180 /ASSEMBLY_ACC=CAM_ASM_000741 /LENGTH=423 /DNA_ID=CAMNT_0007098707 /DNA_START=46 /DNA_END=1317 /DNA_ORIENTATION=-
MTTHAQVSNGAVSTMLPTCSQRVRDTDDPVIVAMKQLIASSPRPTLSLAQGVVHWAPPPQALQAAAHVLATDPVSISAYGASDGLPALKAALMAKLGARGLNQHQVMVTTGANQAFVNVVLALVDKQDSVCLFTPYYFNHLMAVQMTGGARHVLYGPCDPQTLHPDLGWLEQQLLGPNPPKCVVLVTPNNPTGVVLTKEEITRAAELCEKAGSWLVLDCTYEDFLYDGAQHHYSTSPNVIHIFSMSKSHGMMGWRVGYLAWKDADGTNWLGRQIAKVQDTIPICPNQLSQHVALASLQHGGEYVAEHIHALAGNRTVLLDALSPLGTPGNGIARSEGAIYFWARLPSDCMDDQAVVAWLIREHGVAVIPGSACGSPGHIRVAFGNVKGDVLVEAAARLKTGLTQLVTQGWSAASKAVQEPAVV